MSAKNKMTKKLHIKTWGCQMNVYDSGRMADVVAPLGYAATDEAEDADLLIFNTCHIREKATDKLFSELGRARDMQAERAKQGQRMIVAVAGCVAQAEGAEIQRRAPYVDMIFGPQTYHQLPEMIARVTRETGGVLNTEFPVEPKFDSLPRQTGGEIAAFLSIQEGCDKFCTFCVVPYTRGAEYSRTVASIVAEAETLVQSGAREITLLGQNVNAFHGVGADGAVWGLGRLFYRLAEIPDLKRLRYMTSHPRDMDDELIAAHRDIPQLMPFLHLPVQSGSDRILEAMNRKHTRDEYRRIIDKLRAAKSNIALSSDFIVGFPGETDEDHAATMELVRETGFAQAYSFKYSRRPGTPASAMIPQVAEAVKDARLHELQALLQTQQNAFNQNLVGQTLPVLFDGPKRGEKPGDNEQVHGRSPFAQSTFIERGDAPLHRIVGQELMVKITQARQNSLTGVLKQN
ncbi:MAG: tRNA (N6-isopentenyl adenosine(37)-C2)-methylthiotransferase MiaB [Alphaproteobacteria bacterium]|nr:tRNA (N6-isopentenyl adenosine(37)-C2)-methylthiotransferase MiaB [Alphaproteobacteria bacterium]